MEKITEAHGGGAVRGHWTDIDPLSANRTGAKVVLRMLNRLRDRGFTSFIE